MWRGEVRSKSELQRRGAGFKYFQNRQPAACEEGKCARRIDTVWEGATEIRAVSLDTSPLTHILRISSNNTSQWHDATKNNQWYLVYRYAQRKLVGAGIASLNTP